MSPRTQYTITSDSPFLQASNQVFVFTTQLANEAAESVLKNDIRVVDSYALDRRAMHYDCYLRETKI